MKRSLVFVVLATLAFCGAPFAQEFPNKPVRIISAFPSGRSPDFAARIVAERLTKLWSQPVIVEPRPGANGFLAIGAVKTAPADGYTLLLASNGHLSINPSLLRDIPYDAERDFVPVSLLYRAPFFVYVSATGPFRTIQDLVVAAKAAPQRITYSTPYIGSPPHLGGATLAHLSGTEMLAVHFKEGAQIYTLVASNEISFTMATKASGAALVRAGRLRMIAAATSNRIASESDIPTIREAGGPEGVDLNSWVGLVAPRGVPADVVRRIGADIARALADPELTERFRGLGVDPAPVASAEFAALIRVDIMRNREVIKRVGITPE